jgi:hypothetical protein
MKRPLPTILAVSATVTVGAAAGVIMGARPPGWLVGTAIGVSGLAAP